MFVRVTRLPSQTPVLLNLDHVEMFTTRLPGGAPQNARTVVFYVPRSTDDPEHKDRDYLAETLGEIEAAISGSAE